MKVLLMIALLLSTISCNNRAELGISEKTIDQLSKGEFKIPSINGFDMLFIAIQQKNIAVTNVDVLHNIYSKYYFDRYSDFRSFLSDALNQNLDFSEQDLKRWGVDEFELSVNVQNSYNQMSLSKFIIKYFDKSEYKNKLVIKRKYQDDTLSILYYCFINDYKASLNDYLGEYYITKR